MWKGRGKRMIIAAYAGCGKTTFAKKYEDICIEVASMPYARILPINREETTENFEREKAAPYHINNPLFPYNVAEEVLKMEENYPYVIIPTVQSLIKILQEEFDKQVVLCYPKDGLEEEYRERYLARGNTEEFCEIFVNNMSEFLEGLKKNKKAVHIVLNSDEFLMDKFVELEEINKNFPKKKISQARIETLHQKVQDKKADIWLQIYFYEKEDEYFYHVKDIESMEEREFLYQLGRTVFEYDMGRIFSCDFDIRKAYEDLKCEIHETSKEELLQVIEEIKDVRKDVIR